MPQHPAPEGQINQVCSGEDSGHQSCHQELLDIVPKMWASILREMHNSPSKVHLGMKRTLIRFRQPFYWVGMRPQGRRVCYSCDTCVKKVLKRHGRTPRSFTGLDHTWRVAEHMGYTLHKMMTGHELLLPLDVGIWKMQQSS